VKILETRFWKKLVESSFWENLENKLKRRGPEFGRPNRAVIIVSCTTFGVALG
jgi:hypothetical protein